MAENIKETTTAMQAPLSGWNPLNLQQRLLSQLDAATGRLTRDQQQYYADLPSEEFSTQPSTSNKILMQPGGAVEYRQLVSARASWIDPATGMLFVNAAVRP